jgi:hypothetical protein
MGISLAMNAALSLGIVLLLSAREAQTLNLGLCVDTSTEVTAADIAQAGKVRYKVLTEVEQPGNVMRKAASPRTSGSTLPVVSYVRCRLS